MTKVKNMFVKKIAQFNYYLIYDKIPHKLNLSKWKITDQPECEVCHCTEDCMHFLFDCIVVRGFWKRVLELINTFYKTNIKLVWKHVIYGYMLECDKLEF